MSWILKVKIFLCDIKAINRIAAFVRTITDDLGMAYLAVIREARNIR